jgi:hypothetical protein
MNRDQRQEPNNDWVARQLQGTALRPPSWDSERRERNDRRRRVWWSVVYGSFNPRRRRPPRRTDDSRFQSLDWHATHLMAVSVAILLLSASDAFLTSMLLLRGAYEVNPIMAALFIRSIAVFTGLKMAMTGFSTVVMVFLARYRFMRVLRVELVLYAVLGIYLWLVGYEIWLVLNAMDPGQRV